MAHISNNPTVHTVRGVAQSRPVYASKRVTTRKIKWNNSPSKTKSMKASKREEKQRKRRAEMAKKILTNRRAAATAKRRATASKRKAEEKEVAAKSIVAGRTRGQAKKIKEQESEMKNE